MAAPLEKGDQFRHPLPLYPRLHMLKLPLEVRFKIFHDLWEKRDFDLLMIIKDYGDRHNDDNPITLASIAFVHFSGKVKKHWHNEKIPWDRYASCLGRTEILWLNRRLRGGTRSNGNYFAVFNLMISCKQLWAEGCLAYWRQKRLQLTITREFGEISLGDEAVFSMTRCLTSKLLGGSIAGNVRILTLRFDDRVLNCPTPRCETVPGVVNCSRHSDDTFMPKLQWAHDTIMNALSFFPSITCLELLIENERVYGFYDRIGTFREIMEFVKEKRPLVKVIRIKGGQCAELVKQWNLELDASVSGTAWSLNPCVPTCREKKYSDHKDKFDATPREVDQRPDYT
ncbi:hypothetical protein Trco_002488 [Trichoderma cornu-damae]|uniref:Uncharacterized protein n=1 Tax=Trichoderma cornu-damae TaxID=654480 RepID=A0A9P8TYJ0_9HYPO|nr:hypothetical protein Trco_002488 [Trichoderma cornu-damae]